MSPKTQLLSTCLALACIAHGLVPAAPAPAPSFEQAQQQLERGHYADAHRSFALLADCGHRESARIALQMRQYGPQLYGMNFTVGPKQLARWRALLAASADGGPGAPSTASATSGPTGSTPLSAESACPQPDAPEPRSTQGDHQRHHQAG